MRVRLIDNNIQFITNYNIMRAYLQRPSAAVYSKTLPMKYNIPNIQISLYTLSMMYIVNMINVIISPARKRKNIRLHVYLSLERVMICSWKSIVFQLSRLLGFRAKHLYSVNRTCKCSGKRIYHNITWWPYLYNILQYIAWNHSCD